MNTEMPVLLSFVGYRDPRPEDSEDDGPVLSLLGARSFARVVLFCTGGEYLERARSVQEITAGRDPSVSFSFVNLELESVVDYEEIYRNLLAATRRVVESIAHHRPRLYVLLDPGTPQMQTSWFLLVRSGELDATLLQGVPPRFAAGRYRVKEVLLDETSLPEIRPAGRRAAADRVAESGPAPPPAAGPQEGGPGAWVNRTAPTIVGNAWPFVRVLDAARSVARYDVSVLVRGETGCGKGLVARLIHEHSSRAGGPFLPLNCSAITASLAESELFGHVKGAYTGATTDRLGQFRAASGGTVFLDEVGDLPYDLQPKLLRVLEEKVVVPVGEDRPVRVDVRVIAATNRDLEEMIGAGTFRRDLYERLNQTTLALPPLRERREDIPLLIAKFLSDWNARYHEHKELSPQAVDRLCAYEWPGNVRELENAVISMCANARGTTVGMELVPQAVCSQNDEALRAGTMPQVRLPEDGIDLRDYLSNVERAYYESALERAGGNAEQAARLLGVTGHAFRKAMRERFGEEGRSG